jgi:hypothetical protein
MGGSIPNMPEELKLTGFEDCAIEARTVNGNSVGRDNQHSTQFLNCAIRRQVLGELPDLFQIDK